jgi:hypothetical protein
MAASPQVTALVESVNDTLGGFTPEKIVPHVESLLAGLPEVWEAWSEQLKKLASRMEEELPLDGAVPEAMREMIPHLDRLAEASREANQVFRSRHEQELNQHHNPRAAESAWNTGD